MADRRASRHARRAGSPVTRTPAARDKHANERTRARIASAVRRREALIEQLAPDGECAECGNHFASSELVVDHVNGITWDRSKMSPQMRAAKYWREHTAGVPLRALCNPCSSRDGAYRKHTQKRGW